MKTRFFPYSISYKLPTFPRNHLLYNSYVTPRARLVAAIPGGFPRFSLAQETPGPIWPGSTYRTVWSLTRRGRAARPRLIPGRLFRDSGGGDRVPRQGRRQRSEQATISGGAARPLSSAGDRRPWIGASPPLLCLCLSRVSPLPTPTGSAQDLVGFRVQDPVGYISCRSPETCTCWIGPVY